ncbi:MAG: (d)CMP kinase [Pseudomonadales bacterium]|nr:(d)CMP kinase [Pseudomonadales bacterium]MCP5214135.1 (d)CMP kinase [Pseudomonadales bacterium]
MTENLVPVITIDGPGGSGKGTISYLLAKELGWHLLDSGALYRVLALAAEWHAVQMTDEVALEVLAAHLDVQFLAVTDTPVCRVILEGEDVSEDIREEGCGNNASIVAAFAKVRAALLERQRAFREVPGLVADGRDMGTVVFTDAAVKVFLTASAGERAKRRHNQLKEKGFDVSLRDLFEDIQKRDERDANRSVSPLRPAPDSLVLDSTNLGIEEVFERVMIEVKKKVLISTI